MSRYAVFLRAINLGPQRRISSTDLQFQFEKLGFENVQTFRTSGNVVFDGVTIFLRTANELKRLAAQRPFSARVLGASGGKLQVLLLSSKPSGRKQGEVIGLATREDRLVFGDRELYWLPRGGTQASSLNISTIEKLVGPTTMRTKGMIEEIASKFFTD